MSTLSVLSRRAYGGRKNPRNVLRSRFAYEKLHFLAPAGGLYESRVELTPAFGAKLPGRRAVLQVFQTWRAGPPVRG